MTHENFVDPRGSRVIANQRANQKRWGALSS